MSGKTVFEHAFHKALMGEIDIRQCEEFDDLERFEVLPMRAGTTALRAAS